MCGTGNCYWVNQGCGVTAMRGQSEIFLCGTSTLLCAAEGKLSTMRGRERNVNMWDWFWLLGNEERVTALRVTERDIIVWECY